MANIDSVEGRGAASIRARFGLTRVINASGTYTPLGVSRSSPQVGDAVAAALGEFLVIDELQAEASRVVANWTGARAGAVMHCVSAGISMAIAAAMAGDAPQAVAALPDSDGLPNRVVIPAVHAIDYGHPILTDIRLVGASPVLAGSTDACTIDDLERALTGERIAYLLLVSSRLVRGPAPEFAAAVTAAHRRGVPAIIDGAAQDLRIADLLATGADAVLVSAHKYLAAPTAGLLVGTAAFVRAFRAQERGIGRAMKASKEAIVGVLAAIELRQRLDMPAWRAAQANKVQWFLAQIAAIDGIVAEALPDPAGMPFSRVGLRIGEAHEGPGAQRLARQLHDGQPSVWVMEHAAAQGLLVLELVPLDHAEMREIIARLTEILGAPA